MASSFQDLLFNTCFCWHSGLYSCLSRWAEKSHLKCLCKNVYGISAFVGYRSSVSTRRGFYEFLNECTFDYTAFAVSGKVETVNKLTTPV